MRDLLSIKNQALQREGQPIVKPSPIRVHQTRSITGLRQDEVKHDPNAQDILNGIKMNSSLKRAISKKKVELQTLSDTTKSLVTGAGAEVDRILVDARKRANLMIAEAKQSKSKADTILQKNEAHQKELEKLDEEIAKRELQSKDQQKIVDSAIIAVEKDKKDVDEALRIASKRKIEIVDTFNKVVELLQTALELMPQVQDLENNVESDVSQTQEKTDRMMQRVAILVKEIDIDRSTLNEKAIELQNREKLLADRTQQFDRVQKEMKQKQYGK